MGIGVGAAVLGAGALGAAGSVAGGLMQSSAANNASKTNLSMYEQTRQSLMPYINAGTGALPQLNNLLGLGPGGMSGALSTLQNMPGYQWAYGQGLQATNQSLAAQGLVGSGGQMAALTQYGQGFADQQYNTYVNQLQGLANSGANAAAGLGQQGTQAAAQAGQAQYASGTSLASGITGLTNNLGSGLLTNSLLSNGSYGGYTPPVGGVSSLAPLTDFATLSDRRLKADIKRIGTLDSGLPVYSFRYKGSHLPQVGVMAQDVEQIAPSAVHEHPVTGYKVVQLAKVAALPARHSYLPDLLQRRAA